MWARQSPHKNTEVSSQKYGAEYRIMLVYRKWAVTFAGILIGKQEKSAFPLINVCKIKKFKKYVTFCIDELCY